MSLITECVGLDVGRSAIKAVRIRRPLGHRDAVTCFESVLPVSADPQASPPAAELLREFVRRHRLDRTTVVTALPCRDLVIRTLALPFRDADTLGRVVPFEMEGVLPFPLEEAALDYFPLPPAEGAPEGDGAADPNLLVAAVPRATLSAHLEQLAQAGVQPAAVNVDALALYSVTRYLAGLSGGASSGLPPDFMLADVGASKTTLCLVHRGRPIILRTIHLGGDALTAGLARKEGCAFEEAESLKHAATAAQLEPWLAPLAKELRHALHAYEAQTRARLRSYWLCGGTAKLNGINAWLERQLDLEPLGNGQGFGHLCPPTFSIAFGLAIRGARREPGWNPLARPGRSRAVVALDFKRALDLVPREPRETRRDLRLAGLAALLVAALALGDLWIQVAVHDTHVRQLAAALQAQYGRQFGGAAPPGEEVDLARRKLDDAGKTLAFLQGSQSLVLPVLAELVRRTPGAGGLKIQSVTIENDTVSLEAETGSFESVDTFKQRLAGSPLFQNVAVSDAHVGMSPAQVLFHATFTVRAP